VPRSAASAKRPVWKGASDIRLIPADAVATAKPAASVPPALQLVRAEVDTRGRGLWHAIISHGLGKAASIFRRPKGSMSVKVAGRPWAPTARGTAPAALDEAIARRLWEASDVLIQGLGD